MCLFAIIFYQKAWLIAIQYMLSNPGQAGGIPTSTTQIAGFSIPTASAPVSLGKEAIINDLGISVTRVISPADSYLGKAALPSVARDGKEYLIVDVKVRCISPDEKCHLSEFDFGIETKGGHDYAAELTGSYSDLQGLLVGGDIEPGKSLSGSLIFIIEKGETGLTLIYPRLFAFGGSAKLLLGK
jgi:Telomeric repeat-binding factor 2.